MTNGTDFDFTLPGRDEFLNAFVKPPVPLPLIRPRWADVMQVTPLRVQMVGDSSPVEVTPESLVSGLQVGDRVWTALTNRGALIVVGKSGGSEVYTKSEVDALLAPHVIEPWVSLAPYLVSPWVPYVSTPEYQGIWIRRNGTQTEIQGTITRPAGQGDLTGATSYALSTALPAKYRASLDGGVTHHLLLRPITLHGTTTRSTGAQSAGTAHTHNVNMGGFARALMVTAAGILSLYTAVAADIAMSDSAGYLTMSTGWASA